MKNKNNDWIIIGRFYRPQGIKGFVIINSFTEPSSKIFQYNNWYSYINNQWQALTLLQAKITKNLLLAQIKDYESREKALELGNIEIAIRKEQLLKLEDGEFYWYELIGMSVVNNHGIILGLVQKIFPTGSNDVLVVEGNKRYLIPYLPDQFILEINLNQKKIIVDWDENF